MLLCYGKKKQLGFKYICLLYCIFNPQECIEDKLPLLSLEQHKLINSCYTNMRNVETQNSLFFKMTPKYFMFQYIWVNVSAGI